MLYATSFRIRHFMLTVVLFFAGAVVANASVSASFRGPDSVHLAYGFDAGGKDWRIIVNSSDILVAGAAGGEIVGTYHHTEVSPDIYTYVVQTKDDKGEWKDLSTTGNVEIDGESAKGKLLYDESYTSGLRTGNVTVPSGRALELGGLIEGTETASGSITIESGAQITLGPGTEFSKNVSISFGEPVSIQDIVLGRVSFSASATGSSMENVAFSECFIAAETAVSLGGTIEGRPLSFDGAPMDVYGTLTFAQDTAFSDNVLVSFHVPVSLQDIVLGGVVFYESAKGSSMENVIFSSGIIRLGATVELKGFIESRPDPESLTGERLEADLGVYGTVTFATDVEIGSKVHIGLYSAHQISGLTSGHLVLEAEGSVISDSSDLKIDPRKGGTLSQLMNCVIFLEYAESSYDTTGLLEGYKLVISDSTIFSIGRQASRGRYELNNVVWKNPVYFAGDSETQVLDSDFQGQVRVGYDYIASPDAPQPETVFNARNTRFHSMDVQRVLTGNVRFDTSLFKGDVGVYGGASEFDGCEFGGIVTLVNRSTTKIQNSLFLKDLKFLNAASTAQAYPDAPRWFEQPSPSPNIEQNAFMGEVAISYEKPPSQQSDPLPSAKIAIGPNYYGDKNGFLVNVAPGFLASTGKHFGAQIPGVGVTSATDIFDLTKALADSPISGTRLDTRVFPKFWVNGHVVGQNTLQHQNSTLDDAAQLKLIPGRPTLLSVNVMTTEPSLSGVRVYANWNGQKIYARNRVPMRRDISTFTTNQITYGAATFDIVLPGVAEKQMPVQVMLETAGISGFDADADPGDIPLLSGAVSFIDPFSRPLRIHVTPIQLHGLFGGVVASASGGSVVQALKNEIPEMLSLPPDKVEVTLLPRTSFWSPASALTTVGTMNGIAASLAMARGVSSWIHDNPADFIVAVMPAGWISGGGDGASMALRRSVLFVDEKAPLAALHELGHGIGLNTGWGGEQYDQHPPNGLPVDGMTAFATEGGSVYGDRFRVRHMPAKDALWYGGSTHYDIMGNTNMIWPINSTVHSFKAWFMENLGLVSTTSMASTTSSMRTASLELPSVSPQLVEGPVALQEGESTIKVLISGALQPVPDNPSRMELVAETLAAYNVTGLDTPDVSAVQNGLYYHEHRLTAFDAQGNEIYTNVFYIPEEGYGWSGSFDLPQETDAYVVEKKISSYPDSYRLILRVESAGLLSTQWTSPAPGTAIGVDLKASWTAQVSSGSPDGRVMHAVFYQDEVNGPWHLALSPTYETSITGTSEFLPQTDYLRLMLVSSDGIHSVSAILENLSVPARPPLVHIVHPLEGDNLQSDGELYLQASVKDYDGSGYDSGTWTSSVQGPLGNGPNLTVTLENGTHELSYEVLGKNGLRGSAAVTVTAHETMNALDLRLDEGDLSLQNAVSDPTGMIPELVLPGGLNRFTLKVRNQGVDATVVVNMQVLHPSGGAPELLPPVSLSLEPFETVYVPFDSTASGVGDYIITARLDEVVPTDPDTENNERSWTISSYLPKIEPAPEVLQLQYARNSGDPESYYPTAEGTLKVYNRGSSDLNISSIELIGEHAAAFEIREDNLTGATIPPRGSASVKLRGEARFGSVAHGRLRIHSNDPAQPAADALLFAIVGVWTDVYDGDRDGLTNGVEIYAGTDPEMADTDGDGRNDMEALYASISAGAKVLRLGGDLGFGDVQAGNTAEKSLLMHNFGTENLTITGITYPDGFSGPAFSGTLSAGGSTTVAVTFSPVQKQVYNGTITVTADHDAGENTRLCSGNGISPDAYEVSVNVSPADSGTVTGAGTYANGNEATVQATPGSGFSFVHWTEDGVIVSTEAVYIFTVEGPRNLVALFADKDTDDDGIFDDWEMFHFGDLETASATTDNDKDGYTDLQEFLNHSANATDPAGEPYDPNVPNAPGGTGYVQADDDFWTIMIPVIINSGQQQ